MQTLPMCYFGLRLLLLATVAVVPAGTNATESLAVRLQGRLSATWQGQELGIVLNRIAESQGIAIWLDRRVDPNQVVNAQLKDVTLADALDQVLKQSGIGWTVWGEIVYVGPGESAQEFATIAAIARSAVAELSASRRTPWMTGEAVSWSRLARPRELLLEWLGQGGIAVKNPEALGHDLWDAKQLPALPLVDRVVLLLVGYDATCKISANGKSCEIVSINHPARITQQYTPGRRMRELVAEFRDQSEVMFDRRGSRVAITGRWEDHQRARNIIAGTTSQTQGSESRLNRREERRFSLTLENQPVGKVIDQLAAQLGLVVEWSVDSKQTDTRSKLISCEIKDGTLEDLLAAILRPAGLEYSLEGKRLEIRFPR